jgi:hypothetical protein
MAVKVISGANDESLNVCGSTVGEVRRRFASALNIAAGTTAILDDEIVGDDTVIQDGSKLQFVRSTAEKG